MFTATGVSETELCRQGRKVVRRAGKQVLRPSEGGKHFALAHRCPHEGNPLSEGTYAPGCVQACNRHNWKFNVVTGTARASRYTVRPSAIAIP